MPRLLVMVEFIYPLLKILEAVITLMLLEWVLIKCAPRLNRPLLPIALVLLKMKTLSSQGGFTLVELLVTISIMTILFGIGISRYLDFNQSRRVKEAAQTLRADLRYARDRALAGEKVPGCTTLIGWYVVIYPHSYVFGCRCANGDYPSKTISMPGEVTLAATPITSFVFRPLGLGADFGTATQAVIDVSWSGSTYLESVRVTSGEVQ